MWYVIQTIAGQEENLIFLIDNQVDHSTYNSCFVIKAEQMRRLEGKQLMQKRILFAGYVFVDTNYPTSFYMQLKRINQLSKMLAEDIKTDDSSFLPVRIEEQCIFEKIMDASNVVRLSLVNKSKNGFVVPLYGPLCSIQDDIVDVDFHHRRAFVNVHMPDGMKKIMMGICTEQDLRDNNLTDRLECINKVIQKTCKNSKRAIAINAELEGLKVGSFVTIASGIYGNEMFRVSSVNTNKGTIKVVMRIFGTEMDVEMGIEEVRLIEQQKNL